MLPDNSAAFAKASVLENLIGLSVDLHNLNACVQRNCRISVVQWLVLKRIIEQPGLSAGSLAEITGVQPSTLTPTINRLEAMGLIYIQERPNDLRRKLLLTSWLGLETFRNTAEELMRLLKDTESKGYKSSELEDIRLFTRQLTSSFQGQSRSKDDSPK